MVQWFVNGLWLIGWFRESSFIKRDAGASLSKGLENLYTQTQTSTNTQVFECAFESGHG